MSALLPSSALFEQHHTCLVGRQVRRLYDDATETWWFSVVDIVQALIQQPDQRTARKYWNKLKQRLGAEGSQLVTNCHQLKLEFIQPVTEYNRDVPRMGLVTDRYKLSPLYSCVATDAK